MEACCPRWFRISLPGDVELLERLAGADTASARRMAAAGAEAIGEDGWVSCGVSSTTRMRR